MHSTELIASLVEDRVLVFGSLPPHGRDLDLLVRPPEEDTLARSLTAHGFERQGQLWGRFDSCGVEVVELAPAETWQLPATELEELFAEARPIEASGKVCRPAPHHALLILARRTMREGPELREPRRKRIEDELVEDRHAFDLAHQRASAWRATRSLPALEQAYGSERPLPIGTRWRAIAEELAGSRVALGAAAGASRAVLSRPRRGALIAFSGLDGSGKSSQATYLAASLDRLGWDAVVLWTSVASHPRWLGAVSHAVKRPLAAVAGLAGEPPASEPTFGAPRGSDDPAKALRSRSSVLTFAWSMTVTVRVALELVRVTWPALLRGKLVVCDRYELDTWVHLLYQYGESRRFRLQLAIVRLASPRPRFAYLLDISPDTAFRRKPDYTVDQNARRARIYREKARELGVRVIDGERPAAEICAQVAREVWRSLS